MKRGKVFNKKPLRALGSNAGLSLAELLIVMVIMMMVIFATIEITFQTVSLMISGTSQNLAQGSVEQVVNTMAEDVRGAGSKMGLEHIRNGSNGTTITFTRIGQNLDAFSGSDDTEYDEACYQFVGPTGGDPYQDSYRTGFIRGGVGSGANSTGPNSNCSTNYHRLNDMYSDVRNLTIQYCRPSGTNGAYNCSSSSIDNAGNTASPPNYRNTAACVWMVKISVQYSRKLPANGPAINPSYYNDVINTYQTAVSPRNIFMRSLGLNIKNDSTDPTGDRVDCCQAKYGYDAPWCPPAVN